MKPKTQWKYALKWDSGSQRGFGFIKFGRQFKPLLKYARKHLQDKLWKIERLIGGKILAQRKDK